MRLGVISDTHSDQARVLRALELFRIHEVDAVIHCGDIDSAETVLLFAPWPTHFVLGNVDDPKRLPAAIARAGKVCHGQFGSLDLEGKRIAFLHGDDPMLLEDTIAGGQWDLVCHGHTHVARQAAWGPTLVLNPGALYRSSDPSVALVDLPSLRITSVSLQGG